MRRTTKIMPLIKQRKMSRFKVSAKINKKHTIIFTHIHTCIYGTYIRIYYISMYTYMSKIFKYTYEKAFMTEYS